MTIREAIRMVIQMRTIQVIVESDSQATYDVITDRSQIPNLIGDLIATS